MKHAYPFYSLVRGLALTDVYHTQAACQIGQSIAEADRRSGHPDGWPECPFCKLHQQPNQAAKADMQL